MKTTIIIISLMLTGIFSKQHLFVTSKTDHSDSSGFNADFECKLIVNKKVFKVGELPEFKVEIKNLTTKEIYLIGSLDASEEKWRLPHCYFTIDKPFKDSTLIERCGNMNTLRLKDFRLVKPNGIFDPYENLEDYGFFSSFAISHPKNFGKTGVYKIQFHYSTKSNDINDFIGDGFGDDKKELTELFKKVPRIELSSNIIEIEINE